MDRPEFYQPQTIVIMKKQQKFDVYDFVTNLICKKLESGVAPWRRTWGNKSALKTHYAGPQNYITKKPYNGVNYVLLSCTPYNSPYFLTFKQVGACNGLVKQGEKALPVVYWNVNEKEVKNISSGELEKKKYGLLKMYYVFNLEQTTIKYSDALPNISNENNQVDNSIETCENIILQMPNPPKLESKDRSRAYYSPMRDLVNMPSITDFDSPEEYYATFYHELIHSTGHEKRLNRKEINQVSKSFSQAYSKEELTAEMGAAYLCTISGIENITIDNATAYLKGWLQKLKSDTKFLFEASGKAKSATKYILNQQ